MCFHARDEVDVADGGREGGRERRAGWSHVGARLEVKVERLLQVGF